MTIINRAISEDCSEVYAALDAICESTAAKINGLSVSLSESAALSEAALVDFFRQIVAWLRDFARRIAVFVRKVLNVFRGRYETKIKRLEAQGVNPAVITGVHGVLDAAAGRNSTSYRMTSKQLLSTEGWKHPTNTSTFEIHPCAGAGIAAKAIKDYEQAYVKYFQATVENPRAGDFSASRALNRAFEEVMGATASQGGYTARELMGGVGREKWYLGKPLEASIASVWYTSAEKKLAIIESDLSELQRETPGETIAGMFERLQATLKSRGVRYANPQSAIDELRVAGNKVVEFHNTVIRSALLGYQNMAGFMVTCLKSVAEDDIEGSTRPASDTPVPALTYRETVEYLNEGLGNVIKNLATGNVEEEIEELAKEARDIHTPEQQRYVITKIVRLLEKLIILRHNPGGVQKFVHDSAAFFQRVFGDDNAGKEMDVRMGEAIRDLSNLRDQVLAKKWNDDKWNRGVQELKDKVTDLLDKAAEKSPGDEL